MLNIGERNRRFSCMVMCPLNSVNNNCRISCMLECILNIREL